MEEFIDLKRKKKVEKVPDLPVHLAQPELVHELPVKQTLSNHALKSKKTFHSDGPTLLPQTSPRIFHHEDPLKKFGVNLLKYQEDDFDAISFSPTSRTKPVGNFVRGRGKLTANSADQLLQEQSGLSLHSLQKASVKFTSVEGLRQMLAEIGPLRGDHGCIVDENFQPDADVYNKEVHYIVDKLLGKGSNGKAELCYDSNSGKPFVMKEISKNSLRQSEVLVPMNVNHENLTKFYGLIQEEESQDEGGKLRMKLMLEYGGTALNHLLLDETLTVPEIWELTSQGLKALQQLDYLGMVHLDVKPENICIRRTDNGVLLKLTDFGSAKLPQEPVTFCGWTPEYMAPENCKLVMQTVHGVLFPVKVTQNDITGKVDVFAFALVVMYMYRRYHILQKVVTNGQTSYKRFSDAQREALQLQLMLWLSTMEDLVQNLVPDECDLDMRELLLKMTQHNFGARLSAEQALLVVKEREKKQRQLMTEVKPEELVPVPASIDEMPASPLSLSLNLRGERCIPEIAVNQMDLETGPIKNMTKDKLRRKLQKPYKGPGKNGKTGKRIPSKTMVPQTPVEEMKMLTLTHEPESKDTMQRTEKINQVVTQPTEDLDCTEQTVPSSQPESGAPTAFTSLDQWVTSLTNCEETPKKRSARRVERTVDVPPLKCEAEDMDFFQYNLKKGFRNPRKRAEKRFVGTMEEGDMMVSLAKSNSVSAAQRNNAQDVKKQRPPTTMANTESKVVFGNTYNPMDAFVEGEPVKQPQGNLPNFDFL